VEFHAGTPTLLPTLAPSNMSKKTKTKTMETDAEYLDGSTAALDYLEYICSYLEHILPPFQHTLVA
jgi:hypothetical protein